MEAFRAKKVDYLLATDVASRGLDISGIKTVINYDMPTTYQVYIHRCGRTARGDASGRAVSLVGEQDRAILKLALKNSKDAVKHRIVPAPVISKFEATIETLKDSIAEIYQEESEEKQLSAIEMGVKKAQNQLDFEGDIKSRPARVWFQSEKEKRKAKGNIKLIIAPKEIDLKAPKRVKTDGMTRKKKRLFQAREEDKKENAQQKIAARAAKSGMKTKKISKFNDPKLADRKPMKKRKGETGFSREQSRK